MRFPHANSRRRLRQVQQLATGPLTQGLHLLPELQPRLDLGPGQAFRVQAVARAAGSPSHHAVASTYPALGVAGRRRQPPELIHEAHVHAVSFLGRRHERAPARAATSPSPVASITIVGGDGLPSALGFHDDPRHAGTFEHGSDHPTVQTQRDALVLEQFQGCYLGCLGVETNAVGQVPRVNVVIRAVVGHRAHHAAQANQPRNVFGRDALDRLQGPGGRWLRKPL